MEENLFFEKHLDTNEKVLWTGRPLTEPYKIRNIKGTLVDFVTVCAVFFVVYSTGYLLFKKDFHLREHIYNNALVLLVVLLFYIGRLMKKVAQAETVLYCITDNRILIISGLSPLLVSPARLYLLSLALVGVPTNKHSILATAHGVEHFLRHCALCNDQVLPWEISALLLTIGFNF